MCAHDLRNRPTLAERRIAKALKALGFFRSNALFGYIADFYNPHVKLVVEIDGPYHSERVERDRLRDIHLANRGIFTLRFTNAYVFDNLAAALTKVRSTISDLRLQTLPDRSRAGVRNMKPSERSYEPGGRRSKLPSLNSQRQRRAQYVKSAPKLGDTGNVRTAH